MRNNCIKCNGILLKEEDKHEVYCLNCGAREIIRDEGYWDDNRDKIISDYYSMSTVNLLATWRFTTTTWARLKHKWGVVGKKEHKPPVTPVIPVIPSYPEFSNDWPESVQVRWLDIYRELIK